MLFIVEEAKETILDYHKESTQWKYSNFILFKEKMTQSNNLSVKCSSPQLNILKSGIKIGVEVNLNLSANVIGNSNDDTNFPHNLLLPNT